MLALRVSIGEEKQYVACRLYRIVLIRVGFKFNHHNFCSHHSTQIPKEFVRMFLSLFHYILITPVRSVGIPYVQLIIQFGCYNPNYTECGPAGFSTCTIVLSVLILLSGLQSDTLV